MHSGTQVRMMSQENRLIEDPRFTRILKLIEELSGGNYQVHEEVSDKEDELDQVLEGLNELAEELLLTSQQLKESEELFRLITEGVSDLIAVLDLDGKRLYNNPSYWMLGDPDSLSGTDSFNELHKDKDQFIARASHDLRTPIAAILGFSKLLSQGIWGNLNQEQLERIGKIETHSNRIAKIINNLLNISRIEAGVIGGAKEIVYIDREIEIVIAEMSQVIETESQLISFKNRSETNKVIGDKSSVNQILT